VDYWPVIPVQAVPDAFHHECELPAEFRPGQTGRLAAIAGGRHFPASLAFGGEGDAYVAEPGLPFDGAPPGGRVWRAGGRLQEGAAPGMRFRVNV
jgi:hypothetical protein